jgi:beta-lactamase regulating signal transducer with metallopeptidase domain
MTTLFLKLLNMSIMASWTLGAVVLLRLALRKAPKWTVCLLWAILALRLVLPFSFESSFSLIPSSEVIPTDIVQAEAPAINTGIPQVDSVINPTLLPQQEQPVTLEQVVHVASIVWAAGVGLMLLYSAISWVLLRIRVRISLRQQDRVYLCDDIKSPFVLGVFSPRIYIPSGLDSEALQHVLAHENAHIHRRDHLWKPLGYLLLSFHWFNPFMWVAYILLCRDIERACDERVLAHIGEAGKAAYARALLECSTHRRQILTCPVAFGEVSVASRVKSALLYKKPAFWMVAVALVVCCGTVVCFLTNPEKCPHVYAIEVNAASTCTHEGVETRTCQLCEHSYMAYTEKCPHTYGEATVVQAPNCSQEGQASVSCIHCGAVCLQDIPKVADNHNMYEASRVESTCSTAGSVTYQCAYCDHQEKVELPKTKHTYAKKVLIKAYCRETGITEYTCTECGYSYTRKTYSDDHWWHYYNANTVICLYCGKRRSSIHSTT